jgi:hypothetical protein
VELLRYARYCNPFDWEIRTASADYISAYALAANDRIWMAPAIPELKLALRTDPGAAHLLRNLISIEVALGYDTDAQQHFLQFQRIAKASPLITLVKEHAKLVNK